MGHLQGNWVVAFAVPGRGPVAFQFKSASQGTSTSTWAAYVVAKQPPVLSEAEHEPTDILTPSLW